MKWKKGKNMGEIKSKQRISDTVAAAFTAADGDNRISSELDV
jgi:hypothetical protein